MFRGKGTLRSGSDLAQCGLKFFLTGSVLSFGLTYCPSALAQAAPSASRGGMTISAGAMASGSSVQYGNEKIVGLTGFVDADTHLHLGIEMEGRWLEWHQENDVHVETYSVGGRYWRGVGHWVPYVKGLVGYGDFNFPYNSGTGSYMVITAGGGVDYHLRRHRITWRVADFEYQIWPQFTFGSMNTGTLSSGIKVRIF